MNKEQMESMFMTLFRKDDFRTFFSPGRINLIGEHTDYNGGHVFPCAITLGTYGLARVRDDRRIRLYSMNFPEIGLIEFDLDDLEYNKDHDWANYPKGMIRYLIEGGYPITRGMDILVNGNIPNGAGLSSSASIELLIGVMAQALFGFSIERIELVKIGKRVENEFIHVNSGIMDQFAIGMAEADCAILLDCDNLNYRYAPLKLENYKIVIMNTNKRRELVDSKYNERRSECEEALAQLQRVVNVASLGELTETEFEQYIDSIDKENLKKRARHAVYENRRTLKAYDYLQKGDLKAFGELVNQSHVSLRDDYEVTGVELDTLVAAAWRQKGVLGARMTGAGFGGCAIAIVDENVLDAFFKNVGAIYKEKVGYEAAFYIASISQSTREI